MFTIVDIVEQGRVPILFSLQQMKNINMILHMRPDEDLITCEALGLHHAQATQASSSHIVIELAAIFRVPARASNNSDDAFPNFFAGDSEIALGTCPACAGRHRPHTDAARCNPLRQVPLLLRQFLQSLLFLQIQFMQDRYLKEKVNIPARRRHMTQNL